MKTDLREALEVCADLMDALAGMDEDQLFIRNAPDDFDRAIVKLWRLANQPEAFTTKPDPWPVPTADAMVLAGGQISRYGTGIPAETIQRVVQMAIDNPGARLVLTCGDKPLFDDIKLNVSVDGSGVEITPDPWPVLTWAEHPHQFTEAVADILVGCGCTCGYRGSVVAGSRLPGSRAAAMTALTSSAPAVDATPFWHADKCIWFAPEPDDTPLQVAQRIARPFKGDLWADKVLSLVIDVITGQPVSPRGA